MHALLVVAAVSILTLSHAELHMKQVSPAIPSVNRYANTEGCIGCVAYGPSGYLFRSLPPSSSSPRNATINTVTYTLIRNISSIDATPHKYYEEVPEGNNVILLGFGWGYLRWSPPKLAYSLDGIHWETTATTMQQFPNIHCTNTTLFPGQNHTAYPICYALRPAPIEGHSQFNKVVFSYDFGNTWEEVKGVTIFGNIAEYQWTQDLLPNTLLLWNDTSIHSVTLHVVEWRVEVKTVTCCDAITLNAWSGGFCTELIGVQTSQGVYVVACELYLRGGYGLSTPNISDPQGWNNKAWQGSNALMLCCTTVGGCAISDFVDGTLSTCPNPQTGGRLIYHPAEIEVTGDGFNWWWFCGDELLMYSHQLVQHGRIGNLGDHPYKEIPNTKLVAIPQTWGGITNVWNTKDGLQLINTMGRRWEWTSTKPLRVQVNDFKWIEEVISVSDVQQGYLFAGCGVSCYVIYSNLSGNNSVHCDVSQNVEVGLFGAAELRDASGHPKYILTAYSSTHTSGNNTTSITSWKIAYTSWPLTSNCTWHTISIGDVGMGARYPEAAIATGPDGNVYVSSDKGLWRLRWNETTNQTEQKPLLPGGSDSNMNTNEYSSNSSDGGDDGDGGAAMQKVHTTSMVHTSISSSRGGGGGGTASATSTTTAEGSNDGNNTTGKVVPFSFEEINSNYSMGLIVTNTAVLSIVYKNRGNTSQPPTLPQDMDVAWCLFNTSRESNEWCFYSQLFPAYVSAVKRSHFYPPTISYLSSLQMWVIMNVPDRRQEHPWKDMEDTVAASSGGGGGGAVDMESDESSEDDSNLKEELYDFEPVFTADWLNFFVLNITFKKQWEHISVVKDAMDGHGVLLGTQMEYKHFNTFYYIANFSSGLTKYILPDPIMPPTVKGKWWLPVLLGSASGFVVLLAGIAIFSMWYQQRKAADRAEKEEEEERLEIERERDVMCGNKFDYGQPLPPTALSDHTSNKSRKSRASSVAESVASTADSNRRLRSGSGLGYGTLSVQGL